MLPARSGRRVASGREQELEIRTAKAPPGLVGRGLMEPVLLAVLARPRPQQGVAFAAFVIEQVRVDRCVEGGIVELERKVISAFLGALRPGGPDLCPAHVD